MHAACMQPACISSVALALAVIFLGGTILVVRFLGGTILAVILLSHEWDIHCMDFLGEWAPAGIIAREGN